MPLWVSRRRSKATAVPMALNRSATGVPRCTAASAAPQQTAEHKNPKIKNFADNIPVQLTHSFKFQSIFPVPTLSKNSFVPEKYLPFQKPLCEIGRAHV